MNQPQVYRIKLEDKAAFINKAERLGVDISSFDIKDDQFNKVFIITFYKSEEIEMVKKILKSSPKIDIIKEYVKNIIRDELRTRLDS